MLQEFAGGPGQIGLHGRTGLPAPLGSAEAIGVFPPAVPVPEDASLHDRLLGLTGRRPPGA